MIASQSGSVWLNRLSSACPINDTRLCVGMTAPMTGRLNLLNGVIAMQEMLTDRDSTHAGLMLCRGTVPRNINSKWNNSSSLGAACQSTPRHPVQVPLGSHRRQFLR
jgi:hypothetical protein